MSSKLAFVLLFVAACALASTPVLGASFSTVVIDAGHGGHDRGGIPSNIIPEKGDGAAASEFWTKQMLQVVDSVGEHHAGKTMVEATDGY